ncbi:MAG: thiamine phosphate synthase [Deltaproteobacteria bacterium]|nr:thiamine phosphate synthase [Deltaproteobacteria bacterium]
MTGTLAALSGIYPLADDDPRWRTRPREIVCAALEGGATVIQLRLKHTDDAEALELARFASQRAREAGALLVVNDRYDLADLAGAGGVHLGQDDLAPERVPPQVRERLVVGLSTHTLEQVRESRGRPVDYVAFGPVFGTRSKESEFDPRGADLLRQAVELAGHPLVAIGGIGASNLADVAKTGAVAAAVISAIANADDPAEETRRLDASFHAAAGSAG